MKYLLLAFILVFTGCSSKKYFEPKKYEDKELSKTKDMDSAIIFMNRVGASLYDGKSIDKNGLSKKPLKKGFYFLNINEEKIIATNLKDKLLIGNKEIKTKEPVIAASLKGNKIALIYSNNSIELIDLENDKTLFKEYLSLSLANDSRITNPRFMENIVLFPTLDGKISIVSLATNKIVRTIIVDAQGEFNNIIFMDLINDTLIAATQNKLLTIHNQTLNKEDYEIRDIISDDKNIYLATIDGTIRKLNFNLEVLSSKKYKYAKFHALAINEKVYAIESQGYLIALNKDLKKDTIYKFDFDNEKRLVVINNKNIYYDESYITLP